MIPKSPKTADYIPSGRVIATLLSCKKSWRTFLQRKVLKVSGENMDLLSDKLFTVWPLYKNSLLKCSWRAYYALFAVLRYISGWSEKQDGRPGLWLAETFSTSPLKPLNRIQRNLTGSKISTSSTKFVFFGRIGKTRWPPWSLIGWDTFDFSETAELNSTKLDRKQDLNTLYQVCVFRADRKKQDGRPGLWLAETFFTSPLKLLNGIQRNLAGREISTSSTKFVFFGPIGKTRYPPWPLIGWNIFDFFSETA